MARPMNLALALTASLIAASLVGCAGATPAAEVPTNAPAAPVQNAAKPAANAPDAKAADAKPKAADTVKPVVVSFEKKVPLVGLHLARTQAAAPAACVAMLVCLST